MKKLLLSTALTGALLTTSAIAQTTVTGNMTVGLRSTAETGAAGATSTASKRGMLAETQLNVQNKGKLNNGMDYAAGFALEFDANETTSSTGAHARSIANENTFIDLISGGTTLSFSIDHMNDFDRSMASRVGEHGGGTGAAGGATTASGILVDPINTATAYGVNVRQAFPGLGQITLGYNPTATCSSTDAAGCGGSDTAVVEGNEGSAYSALLEFNNLGIKGLSAEIGYVEQQKKIGSTTSPSRDAQFTTAGINYVTGPISIGYNRKEFEDGKATLETKKQNDFGVAYTVGNISYGAYYQKVDSNLSTKVDETYKAIAVGYNLGPVAAMVNLGKHSDLNGSSGTDMDSVTLKLRTSF
ncbi:Porin domain, Gram-negative type [Candidatus Pelagibacterales bacterium]